ncbi:MAG: FkbM family methyltransferase [Magnetospirillum sp.]
MQFACLPDGRTIACVNSYEVDFSVHEIFAEDLAAHGLSLMSDATVLDVGANIGLFALYIRDRYPQARIVAYEPMPEAFAALAHNMAVMNPPGRAVQLALGAAPGWADFDYFPGVSALSTQDHALGERMAGGLRALLAGGQDAPVQDILDKTGATEMATDSTFVDQLLRPQVVRAEIDTVSAQLAKLGIDRVDLLKVDTEGAEAQVLAGLAEDDWAKIRQLLVEAHHGEDAARQLDADLRARGYRTQLARHPLCQPGAEVFHIYAARP